MTFDSSSRSSARACSRCGRPCAAAAMICSQCATADVPSPCIGLCEIDVATELCHGCLRSLEEIGDWGQVSAKAKRVILERVAARRRPASRSDDRPRDVDDVPPT